MSLTRVTSMTAASWGLSHDSLSLTPMDDVAIFSVGKANTGNLMTSDPIVSLLCLKSLACHRHPALAEDHICHRFFVPIHKYQHFRPARESNHPRFLDHVRTLAVEMSPKLERLPSRSSWQATCTAIALPTYFCCLHVTFSRNEQLRDSVLARKRVSISFDRPGSPRFSPTTLACRPVEVLQLFQRRGCSNRTVFAV